MGAHFHQQLGVGVVGVGFVRYQLDVALELTLGLVEFLEVPQGITPHVVGGREVRVDIRGVTEMFNRAGVILQAEKEDTQTCVGAFVVRVCSDQPLQHGELGVLFVFGSGDQRADDQLFAIAGAAREVFRLVDGLVKLGAGQSGLCNHRVGESETRVEFGSTPERGVGIDELQSFE